MKRPVHARESTQCCKEPGTRKKRPRTTSIWHPDSCVSNDRAARVQRTREKSRPAKPIIISRLIFIPVSSRTSNARPGNGRYKVASVRSRSRGSQHLRTACLAFFYSSRRFIGEQVRHERVVEVKGTSTCHKRRIDSWKCMPRCRRDCDSLFPSLDRPTDIENSQ